MRYFVRRLSLYTTQLQTPHQMFSLNNYEDKEQSGGSNDNVQSKAAQYWQILHCYTLGSAHERVQIIFN